MKRLLPAVIAGILIVFASCTWFSGQKPVSANPLLGKWKIDSIDTPDDSTGFGYLLLAMSLNDSAAYDYEFRADTVAFFPKNSGPQQTAYSFNQTTGEVIFKNDPPEIYTFRPVNDSLVALQAKDSSTLFLKKN